MTKIITNEELIIFLFELSIPHFPLLRHYYDEPKRRVIKESWGTKLDDQSVNSFGQYYYN